MEIKNILVTTDFSDTSTLAIQPARELASRFDAQLHIVFVEEDRLPPLVVEYTTVGLEEILQMQADQSTTRLREWAEEHLGTDTDAKLTVLTGTPSVEIVRMADLCRADLIVMATHGRGFISHAILGSTTERVLRRADCPVFVIRDKGKA